MARVIGHFVIPEGAGWPGYHNLVPVQSSQRTGLNGALWLARRRLTGGQTIELEFPADYCWLTWNEANALQAMASDENASYLFQWDSFVKTVAIEQVALEPLNGWEEMELDVFVGGISLVTLN